MVTGFDAWLDDVKNALREINMPFDDWQHNWRFDFNKEHTAGTSAADAAKKANRFWLYNQKSSQTGMPEDAGLLATAWTPRQLPAGLTNVMICQREDRWLLCLY